MNKNKIILLIIFIIFVITTFVLLTIIINKIIKRKIKNLEIPTLPRPFVNLYNDKNEKVNVILVSHPFTRRTGTNGSYEQYNIGSQKVFIL